MLIRQSAFALFACTALTACPEAGAPADEPAAEQAQAAATASAGAEAVIRGRAMYYEKIMSPPGARLMVQLIDNRLADSSAAVIAQTTVKDASGPPYAFELRYDPAKLRANGSYGLHANLYDADGKLLFVTDTRVPWATGSEDAGEFRMKMVPTP